MSKAWGGIGAWADEAERADEERSAEVKATAVAADTQSFPSLKEAATASAKSKKKKKMTLSEFKMGAYTAPGGGNAAVGLTPDEMLQLPTGPRQRSQEEMQPGRLGGGFSSYGRSGGPQGRTMGDRDDSDGSWGGGRRSYGGFDDERRGSSSRVSDFAQPSRADEVDDWGKAKKSLPSFDQGRQGRYGGLGDGGGFSKADEVDNWAAGKRQPPARSSTFGSGFRDSVPEPDRWTRGAGGGDVHAERPRLVLEPRKADSGVTETQVVKTNKPNPFGAARPREEVLAEKGLDWKKLDSEIEAKKGSSQTSRPTSAHSSRPSSAQSNRSEGSALNNVENVVKPRPKVNPFGDAKPREVLLEKRGQDWRKIDAELDHRRVDRPETEEEKTLKEEIDELKKQLEKEPTASESKDSEQNPGAHHHSLPDIIHQKEKDLETLIRELDDKVRFRQKAVERPGSGAGRTSTLSEISHSRSESFDESRSFESIDRPRSRGAVEAWVRPVDDRRNFQGSKERGFFSNRNFDRPSSRERW
ncbi:PREDICTED: eukaryotic translation initiation factor 4B2-like [Tarenaya hassleriana]|uniref:eukaryotic translation initiation factor 4B2-like n=1 Tax=Tarenaya hassleriana TaxID=28532 RepID=UPI00053C9FEB|nr:PREDICTED: eukaryotic translation initiation factor 4B2-like [Tarenaya hassleriana]